VDFSSASQSPSPPDPEEVERRRREQEERQREEELAIAVAEAILAEHLETTYGEEFAREAKENGFASIKSRVHDNQEYRVALNDDYYIDVFEDGQHKHYLCVHPVYDDSGYPDADVALCLLLWLEANEAGLLEVANIA